MAVSNSTMTELCQYLRNWFDIERIDSTFLIENGAITRILPLLTGQYFRVIGSVFNDGVYKYPAILKDERFDGEIWAMAVPPSVVALAGEIEAWNEKYNSLDGYALSPFTSESFAGYSYSKSTGGAADGGGSGNAGWQGVFASRLNPWRKI